MTVNHQLQPYSGSKIILKKRTVVPLWEGKENEGVKLLFIQQLCQLNKALNPQSSEAAQSPEDSGSTWHL